MERHHVDEDRRYISWNSIPAEELVLVTGRNVAHSPRSVVERAFLAADLHLGRVELISPTIKQCSVLLRVCRPYVAAAAAISDDQAARDAALAGRCSLLDAAKPAHFETLASHFARSSRAEWLEAARVIGPAVLWDEMVAPLI